MNYLLEHPFKNLMIQISLGNFDEVRYIIEHTDVVLNQQDTYNMTPLIMAVIHNKPEIVQLLLYYNASIDFTNESGENAETYACLHLNYEILQILRKNRLNRYNTNIDI